MRIDAETASATVVDNVVANAAVTERTLEANNVLREGIKAAQAGDREKARTSLLRAAELDASSEAAWLWLASISEYPEELIVFLNNVLDINPQNQRANEWMTATKALLAKTFVQRGIDAMESGQKDLAVQYLDQALEHDQKNTNAWLWLANLADSNEGRISYLEKVLELEPEHEAAKAAFDWAKDEINQALLSEACAAAVAGRKAEANDLLDAFLTENSSSEEAWILRAHLADGFAEKIEAFEQVASINPDSAAARAGLDSLGAIMRMAATPAPVAAEAEIETPATEAVEMSEAPNSMENTAYVIEQERAMEMDAAEDKSPTQELELPEGFSFEAAEIGAEEARDEDPLEEAPQTYETSAAAEPASLGAFDWMVDTVAIPSPMEDTVEPHAEPEVAEETFEFDASHEAVQEYAEPVRRSPFDEPIEYVPQPEVVEASVMEEAAFEPVEFVEVPEYAVVETALCEDVVVEQSIPMPDAFDAEPEPRLTGYETKIVREEPEVFEEFIEAPDPEPQMPETAACSFCDGDNEPQAVRCGTCSATLMLADAVMLFDDAHADVEKIRDGVELLEVKLASGMLTDDEMVTLGIGRLNLGKYQAGYEILLEATRRSPDDTNLAAQVNTLHNRLEEMRPPAPVEEPMAELTPEPVIETAPEPMTEPVAEEAAEPAAEATTKGRSILVVDDSATVRKLIAGKLEKSGHEVYCAADGVEALEQLDRVVPDLVLLDITMPRMDGYQVCKVIRSKDTTRHVPVVMISGKDGFFDKVRGRMAGTTGYITKPFGPETLMKAVETYLSGEPIE